MQFRLVSIITAGFGTLLLGALGVVIILNLLSGRQLLSDLGSGLVERDLTAVERSMMEYLTRSRITAFRLGDTLSRLQVDHKEDLAGQSAAIMRGMMISDGNITSVLVDYPDGLTVSYARAGTAMLEKRLSRQSIGRHRQLQVPVHSTASKPFSPAYYSEASGQTVTRVELPLSLAAGSQGRLGVEIAIEPMSYLAHSYPGTSQVVSFALLGDNRVLAHPLLVGGPIGFGPETPLPVSDELGDPVLVGLATAEPVSALDVSHIEGASLKRFQLRDSIYLVALKQIANPLGSEPLTIGAYRRADEVRAPMQNFLKSIWIALAVLAASLLADMALSRLVARPVNRASEAAQNLRQLDFSDVRMMDDSLIAEIDELSQSFNSMVRSLGAAAKYIPVKLLEKLIREQAVNVEPQERDLTVMFTDIVGFTSLCEGMSPAQVARFISDHLTLLAACVEEEDGTIDKYIGDALMAFWGAPSEVEDHAEAACRCALRIREVIKKDNARRAAAGLAAVRIRVGVHTGPLVVGNIGAPSRVNYTVIGDNVNIAARLEQMGKDADSDAQVAILISEPVRRKLGRGWQVKPLGKQGIRGRKNALAVYRLDGMSQ